MKDTNGKPITEEEFMDGTGHRVEMTPNKVKEEGVKIKKYVNEGELVPWYYGFGYYEYFSARTVVYIIPINVFVQIIRYLHRKLRNAMFDCESDFEQLAYNKGKNEGYKNGYEKGYDHGVEAQRKYTEKNLYDIYKSLTKNKDDPTRSN